MIVGGFGPWARVRGVDLQLFETDRTIVSVAAGLGALLSYLGGRVPVRPGVALAGLVALGVSGYRFADRSVEIGQVGWGLWVALVGSVLLLASAARA